MALRLKHRACKSWGFLLPQVALQFHMFRAASSGFGKHLVLSLSVRVCVCGVSVYASSSVFDVDLTNIMIRIRACVPGRTSVSEEPHPVLERQRKIIVSVGECHHI